jgi:hypothetical protein
MYCLMGKLWESLFWKWVEGLGPILSQHKRYIIVAYDFHDFMNPHKQYYVLEFNIVSREVSKVAELQ